jgi:hypothetical protein
MKYLILVSLLSAATGCLLVAKEQRNRAWSISQHAAASERFILYVILRGIGLLSFYIFMRTHFMPAFSLPLSFHILLLVGLGGDFIGLFIKEDDGLRGKIHRVFAYTMAASLPALLGLFLALTHVGIISRVIIAGAMLWLIAAVASLVFGWQHVWRNYLYYQSFYIILFFIAIIAATFMPNV